MAEPTTEKKKTVCVVVLGDIGRSPRMQYHAQSLLRQGYDVDLVGYVDSSVSDELKANATIIDVTRPLPFDERELLAVNMSRTSAFPVEVLGFFFFFL